MKIGIDARLYFESGVGRYIKNTLNELDNHCQSVENDNKYYIFLTKKGFEKINFSSKSIVKIEADVSWHTLSEQVKFSGIIKNYNLDLMHFTYFSVPIFYNKNFVVTIHDLIINQTDTGKATTLPMPIYKLKRFFYYRVMNHAVKKSSRIISPSESTKKQILKNYNINQDKIEVIPEGVDPVFKKKGIKPKDLGSNNFILYVGNAYPHKNLEILIDAFIKVERKIEKDLLLVGRSDFFYKKLSNHIRNNKRIKLMHNVSDEELSYLYSNASFLVAPSLMEGFGLTPLEAMSHNCLPVLSSIDAFKEVCENAAIYFDPNSISDIEDKIIKASKLSNEEKNNYKKQFKERVSKFSWRESFNRTLRVYESCTRI